MTKELIKVSYLPCINPEDGSVHRKRFAVSKKIFDNFRLALKAESAQEKDLMRKMWLDCPIAPNSEGVVFLNLTQADFFTEHCLKCSDVELNQKRAEYNANAYLIIK